MTVDTSPETPNPDQVAYWNGQAGHTWAELQDPMDAQIAPLGERALQVLAPAPGERVLDIGCGCGGTTLDIARRVAPAGTVAGVDLSEPMLVVARQRATAAALPGLSFECADAQVARFAEPFDAAFSRFGVMFFADPVAAFSNIRAALRPGGRLGFVCWRQAADNPWMMVPMQAALRFVPAPPPGEPNEPGPFALANEARVRAILHAAGFTDIDVQPYDTAIGGFRLEQALQLSLRVGPLGKLLRESPEHQPMAIEAVRDVLAAHVRDGAVWLRSGTWIVSARA